MSQRDFVIKQREVPHDVADADDLAYESLGGNLNAPQLSYHSRYTCSCHEHALRPATIDKGAPSRPCVGHGPKVLAFFPPRWPTPTHADKPLEGSLSVPRLPFLFLAQLWLFVSM
jgi:hypothetical protein